MTPEKILTLDWMGRFKKTIQSIKDSRTIWVLKAPDGSCPIAGGKRTPKKLCVWGEESHAQYNRMEEGWEDTIPTAVSFSDFMTDLFPLLKKERVNTILVSVMNNRRGKEIPLADFLERIGIETDGTVDEETVREHEVTPVPLDDVVLRGLFDYLDEKLSAEDCKNDLTLTVAYLKKQGIKDIDNAIAWLESKGGYCDCEVLANVEE